MTANDVDGWMAALRQLIALKNSKRTPAEKETDEKLAIEIGMAIGGALLKDIGRIADALETIARTEALKAGTMSLHEYRMRSGLRRDDENG